MISDRNMCKSKRKKSKGYKIESKLKKITVYNLLFLY